MIPRLAGFTVKFNGLNATPSEWGDADGMDCPVGRRASGLGYFCRPCLDGKTVIVDPLQLITFHHECAGEQAFKATAHSAKRAYRYYRSDHPKRHVPLTNNPETRN